MPRRFYDAFVRQIAEHIRLATFFTCIPRQERDANAIALPTHSVGRTGRRSAAAPLFSHATLEPQVAVEALTKASSEVTITVNEVKARAGGASTSFVYGEVMLESLPSLASSLQLTSADVFVDIGSGLGGVCLYLAMTTPVAELKVFMQDTDIHARWSAVSKRWSDFAQGRTVVYCNNLVFAETDKIKLLSLLAASNVCRMCVLTSLNADRGAVNGKKRKTVSTDFVAVYPTKSTFDIDTTHGRATCHVFKR
ncbi:hypothetical protein H310_15378 [Aphanomyces invadans]|uniref:DOT1 domain-containing protein n=1 Tax=Aphanomyces invadans TaxID=157072 RepID=A0A024T8V3_9STRA|nr:hypothetical protein H310_15378 [Aphanomyces invadans]ETV89792.1 hypothetical protein H310_15378 [Aphanomyces invadans]|eukprot:XP_008881576.1 hypothetical protein H310_15378 [Aphanomyces invadans]